ncbi:hypothetical protein C8R45DRAFT_1112130 [Mycena sanguinolenta]|nr:hypothetical protein C8R45DRAFT_1112130 [Mycena sanguinolenta]
MGNDGVKKKKSNKEKKTKTKNANHDTEPRIRSYRVTQEVDGALVCNCPEYRETGKACVDILAIRTYLEFGPPKAYFTEFKDTDISKAPKGKKGVRTSGQPARRSGKRGQRSISDHRVDKEYETFLDHLEDGWTAFGSIEDGDFTDSDDQDRPAKKKIEVSARQTSYAKPCESRSTTSINSAAPREELALSRKIFS